MTFTEMGVTHILVLCPRGFVNERQAIPVPPELLPWAQYCERTQNPDADVSLTWLYPLVGCPSAYRSMAGLTLSAFDTMEDYAECLCMEYGAFFASEEECKM